MSSETKEATTARNTRNYRPDEKSAPGDGGERLPDIPDALNGLETFTERLHASIDELERRLEPIMTDGAPGVLAETKKSRLTELGVRIDRTTDSIETAMEKVNTLLRRVEV